MYNDRLKRMVVQGFRRLFLRKSLYPLHKISFKLSLHGMGMLNYESWKLSGEQTFLKKILNERSVVIDVGANGGAFSSLVKRIAPDAIVYAFEPHPLAFEKLETSARTHGFSAFNMGCGDVEAEVLLYDYHEGVAHASLYRRVITEIHKKDPIERRVRIIRLDDFLQNQLKIERIRLLKTDTEGNDLSVLRGAKRLILEHAIDVIQFEFNEMNVFARVFFRDFVDLLNGYRFYRLLPDGAVSLGEYYPASFELFAFQNIAAVREGLNLQI